MANISGHSVTVSGVTGVTEISGHSRVPEQQVKGELTNTQITEIHKSCLDKVCFNTKVQWSQCGALRNFSVN